MLLRLCTVRKVLAIVGDVGLKNDCLVTFIACGCGALLFRFLSSFLQFFFPGMSPFVAWSLVCNSGIATLPRN